MLATHIVRGHVRTSKLSLQLCHHHEWFWTKIALFCSTTIPFPSTTSQPDSERIVVKGTIVIVIIGWVVVAFFSFGLTWVLFCLVWLFLKISFTVGVWRFPGTLVFQEKCSNSKSSSKGGDRSCVQQEHITVTNKPFDDDCYEAHIYGSIHYPI